MARQKKQVLTIEQVAVLLVAYALEKWPGKRPWVRAIRAIRHDLATSDFLPQPSVESVKRAKEVLDAVLETARSLNFQFRFDSDKLTLVRAEQRYNAALRVWTHHRDALNKPFDRASREHVLLAVMPLRLFAEKPIYSAVVVHESTASTEDYLEKILSVLNA